MKRPYLCLFVMVLSFVGASSLLQAQPSPRFWLGAHGGIDVASFTYDPELPREVIPSSKTGIAIGGEADYWFSKNFGVCAQVAYVEKGAKNEIGIMIGGTESKGTNVSNFSYLQIPLLLKVSFIEGTIKPFFIIGPEIGFKLSATTTTSGAGAMDTTIHLPDSEVTSHNIGLIAGIGLSQNLNPTTQLYLTIAYNYGLTNLNGGYGKEDGGVVDKQRTFSRDFRASIGILFALDEPE